MKKVESTIPESLLAKLYDQTGARDGSCKGFYLFYIDHDGEPCVTGRFDNSAIKLAITTSVEKTLDLYKFEDMEDLDDDN